MTLDSAERADLKAHARAAIDATTAAFERGDIPRTEWQRRLSEVMSTLYLADDDPRWQSGFDGDATLGARRAHSSSTPRRRAEHFSTLAVQTDTSSSH